MKLLFVGNEIDTPQLRCAVEEAGCSARFVASRSLADAYGDMLDVDAAFVSRDHGDHDEFKAAQGFFKIPFIAAIGADNIAAGFSNISKEDNALCNEYVLYGGQENLGNMIRLARCRLFASPKPVALKFIPFDSLYTFDGRFFSEPVHNIMQTEPGYKAYVGILDYRARWQSGDLETQRMLKAALNRRGIGVLMAFSSGTADVETGCLSMEQAIEKFFCREGKPVISVLVNSIVFGETGGEGVSMFEKTAAFYDRLSVPVVHPLQSNHMTNEQWGESAAPFSRDGALAFDIPEMHGMIEPVFIGGAKNRRMHTAIGERVERLAGRIGAWATLQNKNNADKKIAVILNNAVCSGVEATLGRASGLDAFESAIRLISKLREAGYRTDGAPQTGAELRELFFQKKAYSDFRWTSVEDICASGGMFHGVTCEEYAAMYARLSDTARMRVERTWGTPPGEAMVMDGNIVVTGLRFGNVLVMIQPKRGCYGAKCTGEVCKILQDAACPPTHQFLATYWYIRDIFGADACLHLGTHGSLEFLPGKANAMGGDCFSDIAIADMPNLYVYSTASIPSALIAKRRSYAVLIDHEPKQDSLHVLTGKELEAAKKALCGKYIRSGRGGAQADMPFETGRNMYGIQIDKIPTREAYNRGSQAAKALLERFLQEEGRYPQQITLNMTSLDIPRTGGEQMSQMLALLGIEPIWDARGVVTGLRCIELSALGRPRMDVSVHISSILRDTWPDVLVRLDEAVVLTASLDEAAADNYVISNLSDTSNENSAFGIVRIFGGAPGTYANSIGLALKASAWKSEDDLARYFIDSSSYVYGKNKNGEKHVGAFLDTVKRTDATCEIMSAKHTDALNSSYSSRIQGGYAIVSKSLGIKKKVRAFMGESGTEGTSVKTLDEHLSDGLRATMLDDEWKRRMMERGYDGAAEIMHRIQNVFEMQCVGESFADNMLDELAQKYVCDEQMRQWLEQTNPFAAEESNRRLLELYDRGKWIASDEVINKLRRAYLKTEAALEDGMSGLGEIQSGSVDIITDDAVGEWRAHLDDADREIEQWKKQNS